MISTLNSIYLRRAGKVTISKGERSISSIYLATALKNIESLGYTFSPELIEVAGTLSLDQLITLYLEVTDTLREMVGANVSYQPMYPNFPTQVMEASEVELYLNAIIHYLTLALPDYTPVERPFLQDNLALKVIQLGSIEDFDGLICNLIQAKTSISATDRSDIELVIKNYTDLSSILPDEIPFKENVGFVVATLLKYNKISLGHVGRYVKTGTDVLRLAVALSNGDVVNLAKPTRFIKFKRPVRRLLLSLLEQCNNPTEDMLRYKERWIRLGEILHPGTYKAQFPKTWQAFNVLRNNLPYPTFNNKVEEALVKGDVATALTVLKTRPGELARRLDHLLQLTDKPYIVLAQFNLVAHEVATPVLLQVINHFQHRTGTQLDNRVFFPKGNVAKLVSVKNELTSLDPNVCDIIVSTCKLTLWTRFSQLAPLGKTWLDPALAQYVVPFSQRSASKALRTIVRGSRLRLPEGDTVRFFTYWKEGVVNGGFTGRVDIDLSSVVYGDDWKYLNHISFTELVNDETGSCHSGDITSAPNGACEFIDVNIPATLACGGRYVVMTLNSYTEHGFVELPMCFAGWMMRQHPGSGEVFEPTTVVDKLDLTANTQACIPVIIDLQTREVVWVDLALQTLPYFHNMVENQKGDMRTIGAAMVNLQKPNLYDLLFMHAITRGTLVDDPSEAETVFSADTTPFEVEAIMASYL